MLCGYIVFVISSFHSPIYPSKLLPSVFVLFVLRFYSPVNPKGSCRAWSVYLTTLLLGRLSPLSGKPVLCTFIRQKRQLPFLNQQKGENDRRKYFMINLHERMLPTSAGLNPRPPRLQLDGAANWATKAGSSICMIISQIKGFLTKIQAFICFSAKLTLLFPILQIVQFQISWLLKKPTDLDLRYLSLNMWISIKNPDQVIWLAGN